MRYRLGNEKCDSFSSALQEDLRTIRLHGFEKRR